MNAFGISLLWAAFQVTLFTLAGLSLYFSFRRLGPAAGSLAALAMMLAAVAVSALSFSPWPHWLTLASASEATPIHGAAADAPSDGLPADAPPAATAGVGESPQPSDKARQDSRAEQAAAAWTAFWQELESAPAAAKSTQQTLRWPALVALAFVAGLFAALVRLTLGLFAVRRLRAASSPIDDADLLGAAAGLCRQLDCKRPIELRESHCLASPATVGWRRPLVLLPSCWREWTADERRVVLAHEIAHVGRGDYFAALVAQFSLALHFYHPLVHWLSRRLRLEQELAADALGAAAVGGREIYLITLAQMALKQDDRAIAWAARPFLPSRGAFLRRIEMLRNPRQFHPAALSRVRRLAIVAAFVGIGLLFAGLRGPAGESLAQQTARPEKKAAAPETDWSYVPESSAAVAVIRPAELLGRPEMQPLVKLLNDQVGVNKELGLKVEELEEVQMVIPNVEPPNSAAPGGREIFVLRARAAHDWKSVGQSAAGETVEATFLGKTYFKPSVSPTHKYSFYLPDERTIVLASEPQLQRLLVLSKVPAAKPEWAGDWPEGAAAAMINVAAFNAAIGAELKQPPPHMAVIASFAPLWEQTDRIFLSTQVAEGLQLSALFQCGTAEHAQQVNKTLEAAMTLASNALSQLANQAIAPRAPQQAGAMLVLSDLGTTLLKQASLETEGSTVRLETEAELDVADTAVSVLAPAVVAARTVAQRSQSMNNMKQIMLAMHNYAAVNEHFPAAVILGPDGKTPHSWRIELLPYLEQEALYRQYDMNEPWDSENNKKVLAQMPAVFRHPMADPTSRNASYFAITGETTIFPGTKPSRFAEIRDGTSNTITVVEAQRPIPWTKPEDIGYDPAKPLPKLGGYEPNTFGAAFGDGSVRNISQNVDQQLLRAMFTRAGGEPIPIQP